MIEEMKKETKGKMKKEIIEGMKKEKKGKIKETDQPGDHVGIHGIWKKGNNLIEKKVGWTDGCIALRNEDIDELYLFINKGVKIYIRK